jgi:hypothetical protein
MKAIALREQDLAVLRRTFRRFPFVRQLILFGSRATGQARLVEKIAREGVRIYPETPPD